MYFYSINNTIKVGSVFLFYKQYLFEAMEADWRQLVEDIEEGRINPDLNIPQAEAVLQIHLKVL